MGRVKLKIKKLDSISNRHVTYSKRRNGILKKAKELSILCDIDIILLMFSPNGKPTLFRGERSSIEEVIAKFVQLTPQERAKRKLESLEALKKTFKKLDHDVNIQEFLCSSSQSVEELANQVQALQSQLTDVHRRLSCWSNPDKIDDIEYLRHMEGSLKDSLNHIRMHKENMGKHQLMPLDCTSQFQAGMHLPLMMSGMQEGQSMSWLPNSDNQYMMLPGDPNFMPQRDMECPNDASHSPYSVYLGPGKIEMENTGQVDNTAQELDALNGLRYTDCLTLQLNEHYPHYPCNTLDFPETKKLKREMEMSLQGNCSDYQTNKNFELSRPIFDHVNQTWVSSSYPCAVTMCNPHSNPQQPH